MTAAVKTTIKGNWPSAPARAAETAQPAAKPAPAPAAAPIKRKPVKVFETINVKDLSLCSDPLPTGKMKPGSKYDAIFKDALATGKTIKTPPGAAAAVSNMLRTWLERNGHKTYTTRSVGNYGDGMGRVWLLNAKPAARAKAEGGSK